MTRKNMMYASSLALVLLLSGCGSTDAEGEVRLSALQMLDKGDFIGVISALEAQVTKTEEENILLGMAYMGKAGATLTSLLTTLLDGGEFSNFVAEISKKGGPSSLVDLGKSKKFFVEAIGTKCEDENLILGATGENICLLSGLADTTKAAITISYLVDDIDSFAIEDGEKDPKLTASTCAMQYAFDGNASKTDADCSIAESDTTVTFTVTNKTYTPLTVTVEDTAYPFLLTTDTAIRSTAITKDYCTNVDFGTRTDTLKPGYFACPVNETAGAEEISAMDTLVTVLNDGLDSIENSVEVGSELYTQIQDIKDEIQKNNIDVITEQNIIDYLNKQNKN